MNLKIGLLLNSVLIVSVFSLRGQQADLTAPIISEEVVFEERDGLAAVEAEFFYKQSETEIRKWYRSSKFEEPSAGRDPDTLHVYGSSNNAYLEILPDTRITHDDPLLKGENFTEKAGTMAIVHYKVKFNNPGRYYVHARALSSGGEDNGVHVGMDGQWPENGQRIQWCKGRNHWTWSSLQRTPQAHCGVANAIYLDVKEAGLHDIQFSMREDGFEFDKFILTKEKSYVPEGTGPDVVANQPLPEAYPEVPAPVIKRNYFQKVAISLPENKWLAAQDFPSLGTDFYRNGRDWLAINPNTHKEARTSTAFKFQSGKYDVVFVGVGENDGSSTYEVLVNDVVIGTHQPQLTEHMFEEGKNFNALWKGVKLQNGDKITVIAKVGTDGHEFTRGRWAGIVFAPVGKGKKIQDAPSTYTPKKE